MKVHELLFQVAQTIGAASSSARLDAEVLLAHVMKLARVQLIAALNDQVSQEAEREFINLLQQRVNGAPIAYLVGEREFYGRSFLVTPDVLIPRPETELLIARLRALRVSEHCRVLDLGTGSGCIGVTAACELGCKVICLDISAAALDVARRNAQRHGVDDKIEFLESDLFDALEPQLFDVIVSNPPYLSEQELQARQPLSFEPRLAFVASDDGLGLVQAIFAAVPRWLRQNGTFLCEFGYRHEQALAKLLSDTVSQFGGITEVFEDIAGIARVAQWRRVV